MVAPCRALPQECRHTFGDIQRAFDAGAKPFTGEDGGRTKHNRVDAGNFN